MILVELEAALVEFRGRNLLQEENGIRRCNRSNIVVQKAGADAIIQTKFRILFLPVAALLGKQRTNTRQPHVVLPLDVRSLLQNFFSHDHVDPPRLM